MIATSGHDAVNVTLPDRMYCVYAFCSTADPRLPDVPIGVDWSWEFASLNAEALLYIGSTKHFFKRMAGHLSKPWIADVESCAIALVSDCIDESAQTEVDLIKRFRPKYSFAAIRNWDSTPQIKYPSPRRALYFPGDFWERFRDRRGPMRRIYSDTVGATSGLV